MMSWSHCATTRVALFVGLSFLAEAVLAGEGLWSRALVAQEARITMGVDTTLIHVGDPVSLRLSVDHPEGSTVMWADSLDLSPFEVLRYDRAAPVVSPAGEGMRSSAAVTVTSFELGEFEIPPIAVVVTAPDGSVQTLLTDPFRIGVESVGLDESGDIRDIKGPLSIARSWWGLLLWIMLAVVAGGAAVYLHRRSRNRPPSETAEPAPPPRPFHVLALEALDALEASSLLERGQVKEYHVRISEIIRGYVEGQLEVRALELTTREVVDGLRRAALGWEISERFRTFLERCDLVKFAKLRPGVDESRALMARARALVEMTSGAAGRGARDSAPSEPGGEAPGELAGEPTAGTTGTPRDDGADEEAASGTTQEGAGP